MAALLEFRLQKYHLSVISDTGNFSWIFVVIHKGLGFSQLHIFRNLPFLVNTTLLKTNSFKLKLYKKTYYKK